MPTSHLRRAAAAAAVGAAGVVAIASSGPAFGQTATSVCYPPNNPNCVTTTTGQPGTTPQLVLSDTTVTRGQTITATVSGFQGGSSGIITVASVEQQIGTFTVNAAGTGSTNVTIPTNITLGEHTVFARGIAANGAPGSAARGIIVISGTGGTGGSLARTGAVVVPTAIIGLGLVAGGVALKRSSRRGKTTTAG